MQEIRCQKLITLFKSTARSKSEVTVPASTMAWCHPNATWEILKDECRRRGWRSSEAPLNPLPQTYNSPLADIIQIKVNPSDVHKSARTTGIREKPETPTSQCSTVISIGKKTHYFAAPKSLNNLRKITWFLRLRHRIANLPMSRRTKPID